MFAEQGSDLCRVHQHMAGKASDDVAVPPSNKRASSMELSPLRAAVEETGSTHARKSALRPSGAQQLFNDGAITSNANGSSCDMVAME